MRVPPIRLLLIDYMSHQYLPFFKGVVQHDCKSLQEYSRHRQYHQATNLLAFPRHKEKISSKASQEPMAGVGAGYVRFHRLGACSNQGITEGPRPNQPPWTWSRHWQPKTEPKLFSISLNPPQLPRFIEPGHSRDDGDWNITGRSRTIVTTEHRYMMACNFWIREYSDRFETTKSIAHAVWSIWTYEGIGGFV